MATSPCATGGGGGVFDGGESHANDLAGLEALADRHGVPVYDGKNIFQLPDTMRRAVRARDARERRRRAQRAKARR